MSAIIKDIIERGGIVMPYACAGEENAQKTFVILPGMSVKQVTPLMEAVASQYRVFRENGYRIFVFDRRMNAPEGYSVTDMAEDTARVMETLGIRKADLFGASQGGMIAAALAMTHPELIGHLMLGSTSLKHSGASDAQFRYWLSLAQRKEEKELLTASGRAMYSPAVWSAYGEGIVNASAHITDEEYARFICMTKALFSVDLIDRVQEITCKTLVLGSRGDRVFSVTDSEEIARRLGCESCIYGEEYGHAVYDEAPDYAQRLYDFCCR